MRDRIKRGEQVFDVNSQTSVLAELLFIDHQPTLYSTIGICVAMKI